MRQLIKGTTIEIINSESVETVENVLVGEPVQTETVCGKTVQYTVGIPKGDSHLWEDKKLRIFGKIFRTVGLCEQGIDENIPLFWNKKIRAELMLTNADITVYEKNTMTKHILNDVFFCDRRGQITEKTGGKSDGEVSIFVYSANNPEYIPKSEDIVVGAVTDFEFDTADERTVSESMKVFRQQYPDFAVVRTVTPVSCGLLSDYQITAR